jgi:uncharacterized protein YdiU (UPF0061 family)
LSWLCYTLPMTKTIHFQNSFQTLPNFLFEQVKPTPIKNPKLLHVSSLRQTLGLGEMSDKDLITWLNGELTLPGEQRIATRYAGHQFGVWAGQLGDGRAISLGEILTEKGRLEVQTKGSGLTPFSRMGDGKAVIRSSVREYLCSEAMHGLKIPTTRVLALMTGDDEVYRETVERSALVARVFPSNLRFGHFELCYHFGKIAELESLIDYTQRTFFPGLTLDDMLLEIVSRTAKLLAQWQLVGFNHGVMNTDNMSVLGLTIDYGPFGFLDDTRFDYICNHTDQQGRYAFGRQPAVGQWNLERLLICFMNHLSKESLTQILQQYAPIYSHQFISGSRAKLGLQTIEESDEALIQELLQIMHTNSYDFTYTFRQLSSANLDAFHRYYGHHPQMMAWLERYQERLKLETTNQADRVTFMQSVNPKFVLKNYIAQEVIDDVELGRVEKLHQWLEVLAKPFDEHPAFEAYAGPTPVAQKNFEVSCSS